MKKLLCIVQTLLTLSCSSIDNESVTDACNGDSPVYLAANGITIMACANSNVGDEGVIDGITYTVVDEEMLLEMVENGQDITKLATTKVNFMSSIFFQNSSFNQAIGNWDVSNVTSMAGMFKLADSFNQPIENWDVSKVTNMIFMFSGTTNFNQNLSSWNVDNVISCSDFSIDSPQWTEPKPSFTNCNP